MDALAAPRCSSIGERFAPLLDGLDRGARPDGARGRHDRRRARRSPTPAPTHPAHDARRSHARRAVRLHVGHHRQAEGHPAAASRRATSARSPTTAPCSVGPSTSGPSTARCSCRPACSTAARTATTWAGCNVGHALVIMPKFDAEETLRLIEQHRVRTGVHGADAVPPPAAAPRGRPQPGTTCRACTRSCTPRRRARGRSRRQMMAWWGPVIWETYGGMEGAATIAKPHRWLEKPGTVGRADRAACACPSSTTTATSSRPGEVGHIYMDNGVGFVVPRRSRADAGRVHRAGGSASATSATSTTTATCSSPIAPRT